MIVTRLALSAAAALVVMGWLASQRSALIQKGETTERVRVETVGKQVDAKAKVARKKAEAKPHDALRSYCRDC